jgi:hypothetical protein
MLLTSVLILPYLVLEQLCESIAEVHSPTSHFELERNPLIEIHLEFFSGIEKHHEYPTVIGNSRNFRSVSSISLYSGHNLTFLVFNS